MSRTVTMPRIIRIGRLTEVVRVHGIGVYIHWSVLVICAIMLAGAMKRPLQSIVGITSYLGVLLIHECGHLILARRKHCDVSAIELYPVFAITRFSMPWSAFDDAVIAWGGVLAQSAVAIPLVLVILLFGYTRFEALNAVMAILGAFSLGMAIFNLLPVRPLDGATAWRIVPLAIKEARKPRRRSTGLRM